MIGLTDNAKTMDKEIVVNLLKKYNVSAVGIAIIDNNKIVYSTSFINPNYPNQNINENTLFQAASISKAVTAYAALILTDHHKLFLDKDINLHLKSWRLPQSKLTARHPVLLRQILSMTGGFPSDGYAGYSPGIRMPNALQILNGTAPANSPSIRLKYIPGTQYVYSGAGFQILQQMMTDSTGTSFPKLMQQLVLKPLTMQNSFYAAKLSKGLQSNVARGYLSDGKEIIGGWHNYPELGAASLWTTPNDLAEFVIDVMRSYRGDKGGLLDKKLAKEMFTRQQNTDFGLGVIISGNGRSLNFRKAGHNLGYHAQFIGFPNIGIGAVIMTNSENGEPFIKDLINYIGLIYNWSKFYPIIDELQREQ